MKSLMLPSLFFLCSFAAHAQTWQNPSSTQSHLFFNVDGGDPSIRYDTGTGFTINAKYQESISFVDGDTGDPNLYIDGLNNRVGIGTINPASRTHIYNGASGISPHSFSDLTIEDDDHPMVLLLTTNTKIAYYGFGDGDDSYVGGMQYDHNADRMTFRVNDHASDMMINKDGDVGIGTTSPDAKLTVNGNIHAKEVKVDLSVPGPDYVFKEGYDLRSLEEVQKYIRTNGHLPNIPSARKMEENGVDLGTMNMKLLEKIEELTLYILQQQQQINAYRGETALLNDRLKTIEKQINHVKN